MQIRRHRLPVYGQGRMPKDENLLRQLVAGNLQGQVENAVRVVQRKVPEGAGRRASRAPGHR